MSLKTLIQGQSGTDQEVADWCNTKGLISLQEKWVTERTLMAELGPVVADSIMTKLEASTDSIVKRVVKMMSPSEGGIDVGHAATRAQLMAMSGTLLSVEEVDALMGIAEILISPAEDAGLGFVTAGMVQAVRN